MISLILRNGEEFSGISLMSTTEEAFLYGEENYNYQTNFSPKSNEPGSEEIGQRRLESNLITLTGDWVSDTDANYVTLLNSLVAAYEETLYIKDPILLRKLNVAPVSFDIIHDLGCHRRSGKCIFKFSRLSPAWESLVLSTDSFIIPASGVSYDSIDINYSETRVKIIIVPVTTSDILELEIISLLPGVNGVKDRILGVIVLQNPLGNICPSGRGIVIDNVNGLCYTSPISGNTVTDLDRLDIKEYIKPGTSFFKNVNGSNGFSITCPVDIRVNLSWYNRSIS